MAWAVHNAVPGSRADSSKGTPWCFHRLVLQWRFSSASWEFVHKRIRTMPSCGGWVERYHQWPTAAAAALHRRGVQRLRRRLEPGDQVHRLRHSPLRRRLRQALRLPRYLQQRHIGHWRVQATVHHRLAWARLQQLQSGALWARLLQTVHLQRRARPRQRVRDQRKRPLHGLRRPRLLWPRLLFALRLQARRRQRVRDPPHRQLHLVPPDLERHRLRRLRRGALWPRLLDAVQLQARCVQLVRGQGKRNVHLVPADVGWGQLQRLRPGALWIRCKPCTCDYRYGVSNSSGTHGTGHCTTCIKRFSGPDCDQCGDKPDPYQCHTDYLGKCADPVIGTLVQKNCPVMCDTCGASPSPSPSPPPTPTPTPPHCTDATCSGCATGWDPKTKCADCCASHYGVTCQPCTCVHGAKSGCSSGTSGDGHCRACITGWAGQDCNTCDESHFGPDCVPCTCTTHSTCNGGPNGDGHCKCNVGWSGPNCSKPAPPSPSPPPPPPPPHSPALSTPAVIAIAVGGGLVAGMLLAAAARSAFGRGASLPGDERQLYEDQDDDRFE